MIDLIDEKITELIGESGEEFKIVKNTDKEMSTYLNGLLGKNVSPRS